MTEREFLITGIGLVGAAAILTTFIANLAGRMSPQSKAYLVLNLLGGVLVAFNSVCFEAYPAFAINVVWASASIWGLWKLFANGNVDKETVKVSLPATLAFMQHAA